jgi:DNA polymerase-3 subunit beta
MEFTIGTDDLSKGLYRAQGIVEKKTAMPILSNVLFNASEDGNVTITATDLEVGMIGKHQAKVLSAGSITISSRHLYDIVRSLPKGTVNIKKMPNNWAEVSSLADGRKIEFKMLGMAPDEFQALPDLDKADLFLVDSSALKKMIEKTSYATSNDETRFYLNGAYLEMLSDGVFRMVATDGHRLSMFDSVLSEKPSPSFKDGIIIPKKGLFEMRRLIDSEEGDCFLGLDGSNLIFKMNSVSVVMRLLDGQFPEYRHVLPENQKIHFSLERKLLIACLKRISILSSDSGVKFVIENEKLFISTSNPDLGEAKEDIVITYKGESLMVGFNARYMIDALSSIDTDVVDLSFGDDLSPGVLKPSKNDLYTCVVMPIRIN